MKNILLSIILISFISSLLQSQSISELYQQVSPSVVVLYTQEKVPTGGLKQKMATAEGLGSGVLISEEGDILTAAHVVHSAEHIMVEFPDGEKVTAKVMGSVIAADVAHIKLDWMPENRTIAKIGDSDEANIGDEVIIIGAPYGIERSLSVGHISGRHVKESISEGFAKMEMLQTDAAINKGNSGGPMFNLDGEVIGIVSHILSESGGFEGIGFVISSNVATKLFIEEKAFWSGFESIYLLDEMAQTFNLPQNGGLLVQRVVINSPAFDMGLKGGNIIATINEKNILIGGDVILEVNNISFTDELAISKIRENLITLNEGDLVTFKILRAGKIIELKSTRFITQ
ncbi:MAG: trypsin-like peptidase domain-containing protein [Bacteroidales bacterium]|nr:trypsin-like peptidase domain-containing protein [Bacteroidales bacterium]